MSYITREDGQRFVIPSYRDVLTVKHPSQLKKEVALLSQSYGEYITLQKKSPLQYEVAFSPDTGYLLGESIWHHFKKPLDMIYCEAIPSTTEAILVIVKSGSVYLDGRFPIESIPEELVIFLTQQNNFEIYTYGDVPISQDPVDGKFSFEPSSVKSFQVLNNPIFEKIPLLKIYQLQLVDVVMKSQGIGVFPVQKLVFVVILLGAGWMLWSYFSSKKVETPVIFVRANPYQGYLTKLSTPALSDQIIQFVNSLQLFYQLPGWSVTNITYTPGQTTVTVLSNGGSMEGLNIWAARNQIRLVLTKTGITLEQSIQVKNRPEPEVIYPINQVIARIVDNLAAVYPGNMISLDNFANMNTYTDVPITIQLVDLSPTILALIGRQFADLPLILNKVNVTVDSNFSLTGKLSFDALGS